MQMASSTELVCGHTCIHMWPWMSVPIYVHVAQCCLDCGACVHACEGICDCVHMHLYLCHPLQEPGRACTLLHLSHGYINWGWQKDLRSPDQAVVEMSHTHDVGMENRPCAYHTGNSKTETAKGLARQGSLQGDRNAHLVR